MCSKENKETIVRTPEKVFGTTFSTEIILVVQGI